MVSEKYCFFCGRKIESEREQAILRVIECGDEREFFVHSCCVWNVFLDVVKQREQGGEEC